MSRIGHNLSYLFNELQAQPALYLGLERNTRPGGLPVAPSLTATDHKTLL
jgi:hypothetical protein